MMKLSKNSEWDKVAGWWDTEAGEQGLWHQRHDIDPVMWKVLGQVRNLRILEIGCGNGYFSRLLAKAGARVTAIDYSSKFIALCQAKEKREHLGIHYLHRDAAKLARLPARQFDIVVANMMLMDLKNYARVIGEVTRVLRVGGRFVFSIVHPVYSDWQHAAIKYEGKEYYARILKKYLSETADDQMHWNNGTSTSHYHRPIQSYLQTAIRSGLLVSDFLEIPTSRPMVRAPSRTKRIMNKTTHFYITTKDRTIKFRSRKETPMFLVIGATKMG